MNAAGKTIAILAANPALSALLTMVLAGDSRLRVRPFDSEAELFAYMRIAPLDMLVVDFDREGRPAYEMVEAIRLDPRNSNAYIARGWAYAALGRYERAIEDYDEVIRLDPKSAATFISRGSAYGVLEQFDRAIKDLDEATRLNPQYPVAYYLRGLIYEEFGKSKEAERDFKKAKELGFTP